MHNTYETVIGLEVHVELASKTKIFCGCSTVFGQEPNVNTCPVCTGMPGALPVLNKKVVELALAAGLALNCKVNQLCKFDRKNYFYPDNPQNYQISQLYVPICHNGYVELEMADGRKKVGIHEIHMEEDAGKLIHDAEANCSLVDYNRSGVPLIEIVTEPDMRNADEVIAFLEKLRMTLQYLGVSDCKLQEGSMRADVNLSVRKEGASELGTRTEMKNLNSFKAIARAIEGERTRQITLLEKGKTIIQETRRWADNEGESYPMRSKEDAKDYRYFPDPDLPPVCISDEWIRKICEERPEMQPEKKARYQREYGLSAYDAELLTANQALAHLFEDTVKIASLPKKVANWLIGENARLMREQCVEPEGLKYTPQSLATLVQMVEKGEINYTIAKEVFEKMFMEHADPVRYVEEHGLKMVEDTDALEQAVREVMAENEKTVEEYRSGKEKVLGFLIGQTMKKMSGKANPGTVGALLRKLLSTSGTM